MNSDRSAGSRLCVAAAKFAGFGSSDCTFRPPAAKRNWAWASASPASSSPAQASTTWPHARSGVPPAGCDMDADRRLGEVEDACVPDGEVVAAMADIPAVPQAAHDGDRLAQHLVAHV